MSESSNPQPPVTSRANSWLFRAVALIVLAVAAGLIAWLALRDKSSSSATSKPNATAVSVDQITNLATSVNHPVFWAGAKAGYTYELSRTSNGTIYLRYLPPGVAVGAGKPYLTVATYPFAKAFEALQAVAKQSGSTVIKVAQGGLAVVSNGNPASVHVAYPGVDYQVEVYDPTPGTATAIVAAGQLAAFGNLTSGISAKPAAASVADIKALAGSLGHPVYWAGPKVGYTYELSRTSGGQVYIRYLPPGVKVGARQGYLAVATYPFPGAFKAIQGLTKQKNVQRIKLPGGGLAIVYATYPKSIHLAFPGSDYQVEVFDPSAARVRQVVSAGRIKPIG